MKKLSNKILEYLLDMIFPINCLKCKGNYENLPARERWICPDCLASLAVREGQVCPECKEECEGGKTHYFCRDKIFLDGLWTCAYYDGFFEKAIRDFKFNFIRDISFPLSEIMIKSILEAQEFGDFHDIILANFSKGEEEGIYLDESKNARTETIIIPVPLHKKRYVWRGFNQSLLLSKNIGERFDLPVRGDILLRTRNTKPQSETESREERIENIKSAFCCVNAKEVCGRNIVLIDDVCTTSATLNECAKELKTVGAKNVWGLVVARK